MTTITFQREDVFKPNYLRIKCVDFPLPSFALKSFRSKISINMEYLEEDTKNYWMENEGWDGEYYAVLYAGKSPNGQLVICELYHTPYDK